MTKLQIERTVMLMMVLFIMAISGGGLMTQAEIQQRDTQSLNEGLVVFCPFNGNAHDESGHGYNGIVNGTTLTTDRFQDANSAYHFDGVNDWISFNNSVSLDFSDQDFAISLWLRSTKVNGPSGFSTIMGKTQDGNVYQGWCLNISDAGTISFATLWNGLKCDVALTGKTSILNDNLWHHIVIIRNTNVFSLFQDKVAVDSVSKSGIIQNSSYPIQIGRCYYNQYQRAYFGGDIDDIRIYHRALSEMEIQALFETKILPPVTINFDDIDIPQSGALSLSNTYQSCGVLFSTRVLNTSDSWPATVVKDGLWGNGAYSLPNSVQTGSNNYLVYATFVDPITREPAETNYVSAMVGDKSSEADNIIMRAYNIKGELIGTSSYNSVTTGDFGFVCISTEGIHEVSFYDESTSGANFDNFSFAIPTAPASAEIISNPSFDNGIDGWHCIYFQNLNARAEAHWDTIDYDTASGSLKVLCTTKGTSYSAIQLFTGPFGVEQDKTYLLTFKAKSSERFTIPYIKLNQGAVPWSDYATPYSNLTISTGWQNYAVIFKANTTSAVGRLTFFLGNALPDGATFNIDTLSMKAIMVNPPPAGELLPNPGFDKGAGNWCCYSDTSAQASGGLDAVDYDSGPASYRIQCINNGNSQNSIQLFTMPLSIVQNKVYQLTFKAKCSSSFTIPSLQLMKATSPWNLYAAPYSGLMINPNWQTYSVNFTANTTAVDGRITFFLGNALPDGAVFHIDSLSLREIGQ